MQTHEVLHNLTRCQSGQGHDLARPSNLKHYHKTPHLKLPEHSQLSLMTFCINWCYYHTLLQHYQSGSRRWEFRNWIYGRQIFASSAIVWQTQPLSGFLKSPQLGGRSSKSTHKVCQSPSTALNIFASAKSCRFGTSELKAISVITIQGNCWTKRTFCGRIASMMHVSCTCELYPNLNC